jgi:hypothetical protein
MVNHVPIVAGLLIAQGILETLMGTFLIVMGIVVKVGAGDELRRSNPGAPFDLSNLGLLIYGGMGALNLTVGILNITAGVKNVKYRGRVLGIVALCSGLLTLFPCYCFPTAMMLLVYGLVVYLNPEVVRAFEMGEGLTPAEIKAAFD